jgi:hypothetical protein
MTIMKKGAFSKPSLFSQEKEKSWGLINEGVSGSARTAFAFETGQDQLQHLLHRSANFMLDPPQIPLAPASVAVYPLTDKRLHMSLHVLKALSATLLGEVSKLS